MMTARVAGSDFELDASQVERLLASIEPEPIQEHFVVIGSRRYPPKQVLAVVTGLDRADFTTYQARSILRRLGFGAHRRSRSATATATPPGPGPHGGAEARLLRRYLGRWVAQDGLEVLFDAESPEAVLGWLRRHRRQARVWRVPAAPAEAGSSLSEP
ncbi:MAG: hypothetical protein M3N51_05115 [Actinomycetota bacterium]|nr:hypothetical protein [Actinomycetota bacterium]